MTIHCRFGLPVTIIRVATELDVFKLEHRNADDHDKRRIEDGCYVVTRDNEGHEAVNDVGFLRADRGLNEIMDAILATKNRRPGQHEHESVIEYLRRVVHNLDHENGCYLDDLRTVEACLEFFELFSVTYGTDFWQGVMECIAEGEDPQPALDFIKKHKLPDTWKQDIAAAIEDWKDTKASAAYDDARANEDLEPEEN